MVKTQVGIYTIVITVFLVGVFLLERAAKNSKRKRLCYWMMLIVYCGAVTWFTLFSRQPQSERIALLVPFRSYPLAHQGYLENIAAAARDGTVTTLEKIRSFLYGYNWLILNVLLLIPYGILTSKLFTKKGSELFFYGVFIVAMIELAQYASRLGCLDIDDMIHNTIGIGIGLLLAKLLPSKQPAVRSGEERNG